MSPNNYAANKDNPLANANPLEAADATTYGPTGIPDSGRIIARPYPIASIRPDLSQPRRVMPSAVRGEWDGDPDEMPDLLGRWHALAEHLYGQTIDLKRILNGDSEIDLEAPNLDGVVKSYFKVLHLGLLILANRSTDAIFATRIVPIMPVMKILDGERRWTTHWLLSLHVDHHYEMIPVIEVNDLDEFHLRFRQTTANSEDAREPLSGIGKARAFANLLIAHYRNQPGAQFDDYEDMVLPGEPDRKYYAQIANGFTYPIPTDLTEKFARAIGVKSAKQLNDLRAILRTSDELWRQADDQNWSVYEILETWRLVKAAAATEESPSSSPVREEVHSTPTGVPLGTGITEVGGEESPDSELPQVGDRVKVPTGLVGEVTRVSDGMGYVKGYGQIRLDALEVIKRRAQPVSPPSTPPRQPDPPQIMHEGICTRCGWHVKSADVNEPQRLLEEHLKTCTGVRIETTHPILDDWKHPELARVLRFVRSLGDNAAMKALVREIETMSRKNVQDRAKSPDTWQKWVIDTAGMMQAFVTEQIGEPITDYLLGLNEVAREINPKVGMLARGTPDAQETETEA